MGISDRIGTGIVAALFFGCFVVSCTRAPLKERAKALRPAERPSEIARLQADDLPVASLQQALTLEVDWLKKSKDDLTLTFGDRSYSRAAYLSALERFSSFLGQGESEPDVFGYVAREFEFFEVYGGDRWGDILLTSYYEPEIPGARKKTERFSQPIYRSPADLVEVVTSRFDDRFRDAGAMRGRLVDDQGKKKLLPYFDRSEIDGSLALADRKLDIAWADPIDAFFMQIQGSGTIVTEKERIRLRYADQNGHKYQAIGKYFTSFMPVEAITQGSLERVLRQLPPAKMKEYLFRNPSYVFFREENGAPVTAMGLPVTDGRTLAVDSRYFPKGALVLLNFQRPVFDDPQSETPTRFVSTWRLLFDQDTGGAIRGGGRADLYWGTGAQAKQHAGVMKHPARLYYLAPKPSP